MDERLISVQSLKKEYTTDQGIKEALKGVSLDIKKGEIVGLLGVNGAGKTTLSSIVAGIVRPTSGDVLYQGISIYRDIPEYKSVIGFCPQKPNLDANLTLEENLYFAGRYYGLSEAVIHERMQKLMDQLDLHEYAKQKAMVLSGGYKQRFLIARTLMHQPKLIILDEPTVGLDPQVRHELWQQIRALKEQGTSILLTTHYIDEAEALSDRVCIIDAGAVKVIDTPDNLKKLHQMDRLEAVFLKILKEDVTIGS